MRHGAAVLVSALLAGCAAGAREAELRRLSAALDSLQGQAARDRDRVEELTNRVLVLSHRVSSLRSEPRDAEPKADHAGANAPAFEGRRASESTWEQPALEVVRLDPTLGAAALAPAAAVEPPVQLTLTAGPSAQMLPVVAVPAPPRRPSDSGAEADRLFREGLAAYRKGDGKLAHARFEALVQRFPRHPNADNALFWMAESCFEAGEYADAVARYEQILGRFPASSKVPDALLKMGIAFERLGAAAEAKQAFERVVARHPRSAVAELARARLGGT